MCNPSDRLLKSTSSARGPWFRWRARSERTSSIWPTNNNLIKSEKHMDLIVSRPIFRMTVLRQWRWTTHLWPMMASQSRSMPTSSQALPASCKAFWTIRRPRRRQSNKLELKLKVKLEKNPKNKAVSGLRSLCKSGVCLQVMGLRPMACGPTTNLSSSRHLRAHFAKIRMMKHGPWCGFLRMTRESPGQASLRQVAKARCASRRSPPQATFTLPD